MGGGEGGEGRVGGEGKGGGRRGEFGALGGAGLGGVRGLGLRGGRALAAGWHRWSWWVRGGEQLAREEEDLIFLKAVVRSSPSSFQLDPRERCTVSLQNQ